MRLSLGPTINATVNEFHDAWYNALAAGRAFSGGGTIGAVAATYAGIQLWNPAASGKTVYVRWKSVLLTGAGGIAVRQHNAALANVAANLGPLLLGGAAPAASIQWNNDAAQLGTVLDAVTLPANVPLIVDDWLWEIPAGHGVIIYNATVNAAISVNFKWLEV